MPLIIKPGAEDEELQEESRVLGRQLAVLLHLAPFKDDFKDNLMALLPKMELEQLLSLRDSLEALVMKELTLNDRAALREQLRVILDEYQDASADLQSQINEKLETLMAQIPKS